MQNEPFLSVVTPVYNGGAFLAQCIESILIQDYQFKEYIIVNNCSTDNTLQIAEEYARLDSRIRVVTNPAFVGLIENHNETFNQISKQSEYCKMVSADDYLLPGALTKMVRFAAAHRNIGIVGSYQFIAGSPFQQRDKKIPGLPQDQNVFEGKDICRRSLLFGDVAIFGPPTSSLYRSDLIHSTKSFFPCAAGGHADTGCCYVNLQNCDYGFIHEVLSVETYHGGQVSDNLRLLNAWPAVGIDLLTRYGSVYLTKREYTQRLNDLLCNYYRILADGVLRRAGASFWKYHKTRLKTLGYELDICRLLCQTLRQFPSKLVRKICKLTLQ